MADRSAYYFRVTLFFLFHHCAGVAASRNSILGPPLQACPEQCRRREGWVGMWFLLARHSGAAAGGARNLASTFFAVIPAQAGIHFDLCLKRKASTRPAGERVTFFACAKKVTKESTPPVSRSPGILPCDFARLLRGSLSAHPCAHNERARILPQKQQLALLARVAGLYRSRGFDRRSAGMHGFVDNRLAAGETKLCLAKEVR